MPIDLTALPVAAPHCVRRAVLRSSRPGQSSGRRVAPILFWDPQLREFLGAMESKVQVKVMEPKARAKESRVVVLELTMEEAYDILAAVELSPLDNEVVLQRLLTAIYDRSQTLEPAEGAAHPVS